jgi:hypothetical protein
MHLPTAELIILAVGFVSFVAVVLVQRSRRADISRHPYRDPYGDTPGASRHRSPARDVDESIHSAPGTR